MKRLKKSLLLEERLWILISLVLIVIGTVLWLYADYAIVSGQTGWSSSYTYWLPLIYSGIILLVFGTGVWATVDHHGKFTLISIVLLAIGIILWAYSNYGWLIGYISMTAWYYLLAVSVVLILAGTAIWTYSDIKTKLL